VDVIGHHDGGVDECRLSMLFNDLHERDGASGGRKSPAVSRDERREVGAAEVLIVRHVATVRGAAVHPLKVPRDCNLPLFFYTS